MPAHVHMETSCRHLNGNNNLHVISFLNTLWNKQTEILIPHKPSWCREKSRFVLELVDRLVKSTLRHNCCFPPMTKPVDKKLWVKPSFNEELWKQMWECRPNITWYNLPNHSHPLRTMYCLHKQHTWFSSETLQLSLASFHPDGSLFPTDRKNFLPMHKLLSLMWGPVCDDHRRRAESLPDIDLSTYLGLLNT